MTAGQPLASGNIAGACAFAIRLFCATLVSPALTLALESGVLFTAFVGLLFIGAGQKLLYLDLLRGLTSPPVPPDPTLLGALTVYRSTLMRSLRNEVANRVCDRVIGPAWQGHLVWCLGNKIANFRAQ